MKNRTLYEIVGALLLYGIVFAAIWVSREYVDIPLLGSNIDPAGENANVLQNLVDQFQIFASIVLGVSLACFLVWYVLGAAVIRPTARYGTWILVWVLLFIVVLISAGLVTFVSQGALLAIGDYSPEYVATFYCVISVLLYYIASVFFSPTHARYVVWPAKHFRS